MLKHFPMWSQEQKLIAGELERPNWCCSSGSTKSLGNNYIMLNVYELTIITKWVNCAARKMGWKVARGSSSQQQMARDSFWLCCNS